MKKPRFHSNKEKIIESRIRLFLAVRGWKVEKMHGNAFQSGIPDLFLWHTEYGHRWVDVKVAGSYEFTKAQITKWPEWEEAGLGVWIMTEANNTEYANLFKPANFRKFWKAKYDTPTIQELLNE
jgi:hypothetical protein